MSGNGDKQSVLCSAVRYIYGSWWVPIHCWGPAEYSGVMEMLIIHFFLGTFTKFIKLKSLCNGQSISREIQPHARKDRSFSLHQLQVPSQYRQPEVGKQREWICDQRSFAVLRTSNKATFADKFVRRMRGGDLCPEVHLCWTVILCKSWEEEWNDAGKGRCDCFGSRLRLGRAMCTRICPRY